MVSRVITSLAAAAVLAVGLGASGANATAIGGSVSDADFAAANPGGTTGWTYSGQSTAAFTLPGSGTLTLRFSDFPNSFGYSQTNGATPVTVFGTGAAVGSTTSISPGFTPFIFFFNSDPAGNANDNTRYTNGTGTGPAAGLAAIDIFFRASTNTYSFFYDDGGPPGRDDNDYNDLVVNFTPNSAPPATVPEPATLALLGAGLVGMGVIRRRKGRSAS